MGESLMNLWFNLRQLINERVALTPIDCECNHCEPGQTFLCEECRSLTSYCRGGDGDQLCVDCWRKNQNG